MKFLLTLCIAGIGAICVSQPAPTSADTRLAGYTQRHALKEQSLISHLKFESIGPTVFSGRVTDIDANPEDPSHFYVAYASGGLWHTDNNGASFTPLFDHQAVMTIGDIAVHWKHNIIWVGTGENNSSRSSYSGVGMYRSADGGKTWEHRGLPESHHIGRILLHPDDPDILWVAVLGSLYSPSTYRGIYKSTDGGKSWRQTLYVNANAGGIDLVHTPGDPTVIFAATWERTRRAWNFTESGLGSGIYRSDDGGETWTSVTTGTNGFPTGEGTGRIGLDIAHTPEGFLLYAVLDNYNLRPPTPAEPGTLTKDILASLSPAAFLALPKGQISAFLEINRFPEKYTADTIFQLVKAGTITPRTLVDYLGDANTQLFDTEVTGAEVYMTADGGKTWQKTHQGYIDQFYYSYGYYFGQIRVSPFDARKLYILGVPILLSVDGGTTWKSIDADNVHVDHHALWLSPLRDRHIILGNDGGINISYDDGGHWFKCNTPAVGQFYTVHIDHATPYHVYGGTQDNGVWGGPHTYSGGPGWQSSGKYPYEYLYGGDGMQVQVDFRDNATVYTGLQFGNYSRINKQSGKRQYITPRHDLLELPFRWNWQSPILLSRHQQDIFYMGSHQVHRSLDQGNTFRAISPDLTKGGQQGDVPYGTLTTLHESPLIFGILYAGSDDGLIHVTKDHGALWHRISDDLPQDLWVSRIRASAHIPSRVYVTLNGYRWDDFTSYVFVSEDYGTTWQRIGTDLPAEPVNVICEDPVNPNLLYVGTDHGLYISLDRGQQFMVAGNSLPAVAVHDLDIQPMAKHLLVGTHGRSIYKADISPLQLLNAQVLASTVHIFAIPGSGTRYQARWGMRGADWAEYRIPEIVIPVYVNTASDVKMDVMFNQKVIYSRVVPCERGLNYISYDLSVAAGTMASYVRDYTNEDSTARVKPADNGITYLRKGKYSVNVSRGNVTSTTALEIK